MQTEPLSPSEQARLLQILHHPAFLSLTQEGAGRYRLEMQDPDNTDWSAVGDLRWVLASSYELPLETWRPPAVKGTV